MLPIFPDGQTFVTGRAKYLYIPAIPSLDKSPRIRVPVKLGEFQISAVLDTGAPYIVCPPEIAEQMGLTPADALDEVKMKVHDNTFVGYLHRLNVTLIAESGVNLELDTTVYVPQDWGNRPAYIGLVACLDSIIFAIDPRQEQEFFYFGQTTSDYY